MPVRRMDGRLVPFYLTSPSINKVIPFNLPVPDLREFFPAGEDIAVVKLMDNRIP